MAKQSQKVDAAGTTVVISDEDFKDLLYEQIAKMVREETGRVYGKPRAKRLFRRVVELIFLRAVESGYFRFPGGYGSLALVKLRDDASPRTMPDGQIVKPQGTRYKLRYKGGVAVMDMLGTNPHKYRRKTPRKLLSEGLPSSTV